MVNQNLYDFIDECEQFDLIIYDNKIECLLWVDFYQLREFTEMLGNYYFDVDGFEVHLGYDFIVIDIIEIIEEESTIFDYQRKFTNWNELVKWNLEILNNRYKWESD